VVVEEVVDVRRFLISSLAKRQAWFPVVLHRK
jgi:hypothetical protein